MYDRDNWIENFYFYINLKIENEGEIVNSVFDDCNLGQNLLSTKFLNNSYNIWSFDLSELKNTLPYYLSGQNYE